jgi:type VI secretion system secreted protein Hcp
MTSSSTSRRTLLAGTLGSSALGSLVLGTADTAEAVTVPSDPTSSFFLDIDGIPGDSTDAHFAKTIEVLDWSWGASSSISPTNVGSGARKSKARPFAFVAPSSTASPRLFLASAKGTLIKSATLRARRFEQDLVYLTLQLKRVYVTSYQVAPGPSDAFPLDVGQLEYTSAEVSFTTQRDDGSPGRTVTAGFDFIDNARI